MLRRRGFSTPPNRHFSNSFDRHKLVQQAGSFAVSEGIRRWRVNDFENFLIFYRPIDDGIEVIRVLHGARDIESLFSQRE